MWKTKFIEHLRYEKNYSSHTEISYFSDISQFEEFIITLTGSFDIHNIDSDLIRTWIAHLLENGTSARSANRKLSALKSFYHFLQKKGISDTNPASEVTGPKSQAPLPNFVNHEDMELILDAPYVNENDFEEQRDRLIVELLYVTGMRNAELVALKTEDVDHDAKTIKVTGKRNKQRIIPISENTLEKLANYESLKKKDVCTQCSSFFVLKNGTAISGDVVYRVVRRHLESVSTLSKKSPHVLRHSFATAMLNNGADINAIKEILGHASLASTEIYTHVSFEELKKVYQQAHPRAKN